MPTTVMRRLLHIVLWIAAVVVAQQGDEGRRFATWLKDNDISKANNVEFVVATSPVGRVGNVKAVATRKIPDGELLYSISLQDSCMHVQTVLDDPVVGQIFKDHSWEIHREDIEKLTPEKRGEEVEKRMLLFDDQMVKLYLVYLRNNPMEKWAPFIESLPQAFETPLFWTEDELEELKGSPLLSAVNKQKKTLTKEFRFFMTKMSELYPEQFSPEVFTQEAYNWAFSVYASRNWYQSEDPLSPILPLMEAFSYSEEPSVTMKLEDGMLSVYAKEDLDKGEEIILNEGILPNRDLLEFYGFTIPKNTENYLDVALGLDTEEKLYGNKKSLLADKGLRDHQEYKLRASEIPKDLIFALRIFHADIYDFEETRNAFQNKVVSFQNELKVCETLLEMCHGNLRKYMTSGKEDKALLKSKDLTSRQRHAIILRRGEKKILMKTLERAKSAAKQVQDNWEFRTMDLPGTPEMRAFFPDTDELL